MRDIQISRPVLIVLVGAVLVGGFMLFKGGQSDEVVAPPTQPASATAATGATGGPTGGPTGAAGATGATGPTQSAAEIKAAKKSEARKKLVEAAKAAGMPTPVYSAVKDGKEVLIFFWQPEGRDDQRVDSAIDNVKAYRGSRLVVFKEPISNKSKYDGIAKAAEVTQTPGIVMLYKKKADSLQGYNDDAVINQRLERLSGYSP